MILPSDIISISIREDIWNNQFFIFITLVDGTYHEITISRRTAAYFYLNQQDNIREKIIKVLEDAGYNIELAQDYSI